MRAMDFAAATAAAAAAVSRPRCLRRHPAKALATHGPDLRPLRGPGFLPLCSWGGPPRQNSSPVIAATPVWQ